MQPIEDKIDLDDYNFFFKLFDLNYLFYVLSNLFVFYLITSIMMIYRNRDNFLSFLYSIPVLDKKKAKYLLILSIAYTIFRFITQQVKF